MSENLFESVFRALGPSSVLGFYSFNNGGGFVVATKDLTKYRVFGSDEWLGSPNFEPNHGDNHSLVVASPDQVDEKVLKMVLDDLKKRIQKILAGKYYLVEVYTMLGSLPVISKEPVGTNKRVSVAHIYPGEQTDALDAADVKCNDTIVEIPANELDPWLIANGDKIFDLIQKAILNLERPEEYISWFESKK